MRVSIENLNLPRNRLCYHADMKPELVIKFFGGVNATARALGIKQASVSRWRKMGVVPALRQLHVERASGGKLKAAA